MKKTNAMRLLDKAGIRYVVHEYRFDPDDLSAGKVACELGTDVSNLYKTLVLRGEPGGVFVCMVAGDEEIDLKKAAVASGNKKAVMVSVKELLLLTGYVRGGCTPIGMKKDYPLFIDSGCLSKTSVFISAGVRGMQLELVVSDLLSFTGAVIAELV